MKYFLISSGSKNFANKEITEKSDELAKNPDLLTELEYKKFINDAYSKVIETEPKCIKINREEIPDIIKDENLKKFSKLIKKASKSRIKLIRNFPNTIVSKGIKCFANRIREIKNQDALEVFKLENRILVFFESEEKLKERKIEKYMEEAEKYCLSEIYSYIVYTTLGYEVTSIEEFCNKNFAQAIIAVCEISTCESVFMMPVVHPKLLVYLENDQENEEEENTNSKKKKKNQSDSESDDKKKKQKKNKNDESDEEEEKVSSKNKGKSKKKNNKKSDSSDDEDDKNNKKKKNKNNDSDSDEKDKKKGKKGKKENDSESSDNEKKNKKRQNKKNESSGSEDESDDKKKGKNNKKSKNKNKSESSDSEEDAKSKKKNDKNSKKSNKKKGIDSDTE